MKKFSRFLFPILLVCLVILGSHSAISSFAIQTASQITATQTTIDLNDIPTYTGSPYVAINDNQPYFTQADHTTTSFEIYSNLDSLGRCGVAYANVGKDIMPTEKRGSIGQVKPTGWHTIKYDNISDKYLYNRCHLIAYELAAENANTKNLITGTRYLNIEGMLPFENMVTDYVKETGNHVLYRVTPIFDGNNLVVHGVQMEGYSVEDKGEGICYNVFVYNVQPGITIDYATGGSSLAADSSVANTTQTTKVVSETQTSAQTNTGNAINESEELKRIDTNHNGKVTIAEAKAAGYSMPIYSTDWLYKYMNDRDHDGIVGE